MKEMWNNRYANEEYAYGTAPNQFFQETLDKYNIAGKILLPAEGEGRNAIYAAKNDLEVFAFDISIEGKNKALELAQEKNTSIDYKVGYLPELGYKNDEFDALALIYAHFPASIKEEYLKLLGKKVKKGGIVIFEAFSKNHVEYKEKNPEVGGPGNIDILYNIDEVKSYFENFDILQLEEKEIELKEGLYHNGKGSVIRFIGRKK